MRRACTDLSCCCALTLVVLLAASCTSDPKSENSVVPDDFADAGGCLPEADCDDGDPCTRNDKCDDNGVCGGELYSCQDDKECTDASCTGAGECEYNIKPGFCLVSGVCHADGDLHPKNGCRECITSVSKTEWSNDDTNSCDDGNACLEGEYCDSGQCMAGKATVQCNDDNPCTQDACVPEGGCVFIAKEAQCQDKECGEDGCGGVCGTCPVGIACLDTGMCDICPQQCDGKQCGPDGCGGDCGTCPVDQLCNFVGHCVPKCAPNCTGKECGSNGCGGICGTCPCPACAADEVSCVDFACTDDAAMTCEDIFGCLDECDPNDQACAQNCINPAPIEEQMKFNKLYQCLTDVDYWSCWDICPHGSEDPDCDIQALNDCFNEKGEPCEDAMIACFPPGTWTCKEAWICFITCPEGDEDCPQDCLDEMNLEAQDQWNAFIDCLDENGYYDCFDLPQGQQDACLQVPWETCQPFLSACASGDKSCKEVWDCMDTCAPLDELCPYDCLYDGTPEAQDAYFNVLDCITEKCGDQPDQECYDNALGGACGSPYNECIAV